MGEIGTWLKGGVVKAEGRDKWVKAEGQEGGVLVRRNWDSISGHRGGVFWSSFWRPKKGGVLVGEIGTWLKGGVGRRPRQVG